MVRSLLSVCVGLVLVSLVVAAQANVGHVHGIARDRAGAVLPGVTITLEDASGFKRTASTDARGEFTFRNVPPGSYTVKAQLAGFATVVSSISIASTLVREVTFDLQAGSVTEVITTSGDTPTAKLDALSAPRVEMHRGNGVGGGVYAPAPATSLMLRQPFNTEAYDKIDDNRWTEVSHKPLSTFSTDVDTASYANVRRFLNQGQVPPKDAVRIEELINYFSYDYAEPDGRTPITVATALGECPWNPQHQLALVGLHTKRIDRSQTPPRNLVFLVDVSGSMNDPRKLPLVQASLRMLALNLTERDRLALVVYAGAAGVVLPSTPGGDTSRIIDAIGRLSAGGSTNGAQGIQLAYDTARKAFITGGVNRVVLATDGDFNVGVTNQGDLIRLIEENRESGVTLSVLGFGMGNVKDSTMEKLADRGNGNYSYIDSLSEAQKVLVEEAGGTLVTAAKDVKLQIEFNPRVVAAYRLVGYENRLLNDQDFNDDKKDAGDMGAGHSVTALYELVPAGQRIDVPGIDPLKYQQPSNPSTAASRAEAMTVKVRYKKPDGVESALLSAVVSAQPHPTAELRFASAVAEFGMLLRDSEFKGSATYADALRLASANRGPDTHGHRAEFARLIQIADTLSR